MKARRRDPPTGHALPRVIPSWAVVENRVAPADRGPSLAVVTSRGRRERRPRGAAVPLRVDTHTATKTDGIRGGINLPILTDVSKIAPTRMVPAGILCAPTVFRPAESMQLHCAQSGLPPN